jgi:hypothetical protein
MRCADQSILCTFILSMAFAFIQFKRIIINKACASDKCILVFYILIGNYTSTTVVTRLSQAKCESCGQP